MAEKYFDVKGEIAFRLWQFALGVEVLRNTPNAEKAENLKSKMKAFSSFVAESGTEENKADLADLIAAI